MRAFAGASVTVRQSAFVGSRAGGRGGAISVVGAALSVTGTAFTNCTATGGGGGAVAAADYQCYGAAPTNSTVALEGCVFEGCSAPGGEGGAVAALASPSSREGIVIGVVSCSFAR